MSKTSPGLDIGSRSVMVGVTSLIQIDLLDLANTVQYLEQGQRELNFYLIMLQDLVITLQRQLMGQDGILLPNHSTLLSISNTARTGTVGALAGQFQRMAQSAPIQRHKTTYERTCPGKVFKAYSSQGPSTWVCDGCNMCWAEPETTLLILVPKLSRIRIPKLSRIRIPNLLQRHTSGRQDIVCRICKHRMGHTSEEWKNHLNIHSFEQLSDKGYLASVSYKKRQDAPIQRPIRSTVPAPPPPTRGALMPRQATPPSPPPFRSAPVLLQATLPTPPSHTRRAPMLRQAIPPPPAPSPPLHGGRRTFPLDQRIEDPDLYDIVLDQTPPSPPDGCKEVPDTLILRCGPYIHKLQFQPYVISDGTLLISDIKRYAAEKLKTDYSKLRLHYKGRMLDDDHSPAKAYDLKQFSKISSFIIVTAEETSQSDLDSNSSDTDSFDSVSVPP
jgi:hypothetical protein